MIGYSGAQLPWTNRFRQRSAWLQLLLAAMLMAGCWMLVYTTGGTRTVWPHAFYVPILLAALRFGVRGGIAAGVVATLLSGPLMQLDVVGGEVQPVANWLMRGGFFVLVGGLAGSLTASMRQRFEDDLARRLWGEVGTAVPGLDTGSIDAWTVRVRRTIDEHRFRTVFQPIYNLDNGRLTAVEALTRFDDEPIHPPDVWFDRAHHVGLGLELELATLEAALEASQELDAAVSLSFNASPQLLVDPRLLELLDRYEGRRLAVEITEHAAIEDYREVAEARSELRARDTLVAVDDAGAGFASLRHIVMLQPDVIKLDPSLTQNLGDDPIRRPLADALLQFAARTGSRIVVEGIETAADLATWTELGAEAAQGYLLARPGPLAFPSTYAPLNRTGLWRGEQPAAVRMGNRA